MVKKIAMLLFTAACMLVCVVPSLGLFISNGNEPIGNERQKEAPAFVDGNGKLNKDYFQQLGDYFAKCFAFRPQAISADAEIQSKLFGVSNVDTVTVGKNGWLYYSSTLDDYLGRNLLSQRAINNIVHNLRLTQEYVTDRGADFLFTVAPNKNTLYPENMPYYYKKVSNERNMDKLHAALKNTDINYCNLFELFQKNDEVLYLERDSHWNNKGALMAYNAMLDSLEKQHESYASASVRRTKSFYGDLGKMIYPKSAKPEYNYEYDINPGYSYVTDTKSVEDAMISTHNGDKTGGLFMYRDSFGNALLPFFANAYMDAYFTKGFPVDLARGMAEHKSDTVIFEIVERNIDWFAKNPPVFMSPECDEPDITESKSGRLEISTELSQINRQYIKVSGCIDSKLCNDDTDIYVKATDIDGEERIYEAFRIADGDTDCGFTAYLSEAEFDINDMQISLVINNDSVFTELKKDK